MYYQNRWGEQPFSELSREDAAGLALQLLDTASEYDSATGRYEQSADIFPTVKTISESGLEDIEVDDLRRLYAQYVGGTGS